MSAVRPIDDEGPRLSSEIEEQLGELLEIKHELESGGDFGYAGQVHLASIKAHEESLRRELDAARHSAMSALPLERGDATKWEES